MKVNIIKKIKFLVLLMLYCSFLISQNNCPNRMLHFDPTTNKGDYIRLNTNSINGNNDFTFEAWFLSDANSGCGIISTSNAMKHLFSLGSTTNSTRFFVRECGGRLNISWLDNLGNTFYQNFGPSNIREEWHHIAVTRRNNQIQVYLDCNLVFIDSSFSGINPNYFMVGAWEGSSSNGDYWEGNIDEIRLWNDVRTDQEISDNKDCNLIGTEQGLAVYWPLDQGVPNENNTSIRTVTDRSPNGNDGQLNGFLRNGPTSNFVCADYNKIALEVNSIPFSQTTPTDFCSGESAHFCLDIPVSSITNPVIWQYRDGANWINIDPNNFSVSCGPSLSGNPMMEVDCSNNKDGYVTREFRAFVTIIDSLGRTCNFISEIESLTICCPINEGSVEITPNTNLCEGDSVSLSVSYIPSPDDPFLNQPIGDLIEIEWFLNGKNINQFNKLSFPFETTIGQEDLCFEVKITNCSNKSVTFSNCITVDPRPIPGTISAIPVSTTKNLTLIQPNPKTYEICPTDEAALTIDSGLVNCKRIWEYSFNQLDWFKMGESNGIQNTNHLPSNWQPTINCIYYRVNCTLPDSSACEPVISDTIKICLKDPLKNDKVIGDQLICKGSFSNLTLQNYDASLNYTWIYNGIEVGTGRNYAATESGCYRVIINDGCYEVETPDFCLEVCEIQPLISCPLPPNSCACLGEAILLSGCESMATCDGNLIFDWTWDSGTLVQKDGCFLEHIPASNGTTYTLNVTNTLTGCIESITKFIKPCDKQ